MKKIVRQLDRLIEEGNSLIDLWDNMPYQSESRGYDYSRRKRRWLVNCEAVLRFASLSDYTEQFQGVGRAAYHETAKLAHLLGVIESAKDTIELGFIGSIRYLLHAEIFDSLADQAEELQATGHLIPAAVLGRIVIERWLRDEADKAGVPDFNTKKASSVNDELKKAGVFSVPKWRQVQSFLDIGNAAAHGKEDDFTDDDVQRLIQFIRSTCI